MTGRSDGEQVEPLDLILLTTNASEQPIPQDFVAAGDVDLEGVDSRHTRRIEDPCDVQLFSDEGCGAEL